MEIISKRLRESRKNKGMSSYEVANITGIHPATIGAYERGERTPSIKNLILLARIYGVTPNYLLGFDIDFTDTLSEEAQNFLKNKDNQEWLQFLIECNKKGVSLETARKIMQLLIEEAQRVEKQNLSK